jgi:FtsX-like permease family
MRARGWGSDLAVGVRLAVGGGRTSMARLALSTIGITIAVAVLLLASSVDNTLEARDRRQAALTPDVTPVPGVDPLFMKPRTVDYPGAYVAATYLYAEGPHAPVPPGLPRLPAPDEAFVSPALAELLSSPRGERLRSRIPRVAGTIAESAVVNLDDLIMYAGADRGIRTSTEFNPYRNGVYAFGAPVPSRSMDPGLLLLLLLGVVALLIPVFVFVAASSRIAGLERDRRLSALRLAGADSRQVRRIAAAESVVSAIAALPLGAAVFLLSRSFVGGIPLFEAMFGVHIRAGDIVPPAWLVVLIALAIPLLAVLTAQFALRRTIVEPLGVLRYQRPVRRRLWWRLAVVALGVLLLLTHGGTDSNDVRWSYAIAAGATLMLIGVPVLLPWLVERAVRRLRGGPSSWQLAIRRLQVDGGTSARVVGGVAVVLAGAIALDALLLAQQGRVGPPPDVEIQPQQRVLVASAEPEVAGAVTESLAAVPGMRTAYLVRMVNLRFEDGATGAFAGIAACADVNRMLRIGDCVDGDVFLLDQGPAPPVSPPPSPYPSGRTLTLQEQADGGNVRDVGSLTIPQTVRHFPLPTGPSPLTNLVITPAALHGLMPSTRSSIIAEFGDQASVETGELAQDALAPFGWRVTSYVMSSGTAFGSDQQSLGAVRNGLLAGAALVLLVAGVSLLALALEQIRERRRPLAILVANGVPRTVLARSLLWQTVVPVALGVALAVGIGLGLAALAVRLSGIRLGGGYLGLGGFAVNWATIGLLSAAALLVALLMTALTLPFLRGASSPESLRTE